jgi:hypothetical protein
MISLSFAGLILCLEEVGKELKSSARSSEIDFSFEEKNKYKHFKVITTKLKI